MARMRFKKETCNKKIEELELKNRSYNRLKSVGMNTVGDIIDRFNELPTLHQFGAGSISDVKSKLLELWLEQQTCTNKREAV